MKTNFSSLINPTRFAVVGMLVGLLGAFIAARAAGTLSTGAPDDAATKWQVCEGWPPGCEFAGIWLDQKSGASGAYVRAPKAYFFQRASHTATERILVLSGRVSGGIDGAGDGTLTPGMYWNIPAKSVHWARCEDACLMYIEFDQPYDHTFH